MLAECVVIIIILAIAGYMFIRSKRKAWFPGVFPLMLVPLVNIIFSPHFIETHFQNGHLLRIIIYLAAFGVSSVWLYLWSKTLPYKKSRWGYIVCSTIYNIILILVLLIKGMQY